MVHVQCDHKTASHIHVHVHVDSIFSQLGCGKQSTVIVYCTVHSVWYMHAKHTVWYMYNVITKLLLTYMYMYM